MYSSVSMDMFFLSFLILFIFILNGCLYYYISYAAVVVRFFLLIPIFLSFFHSFFFLSLAHLGVLFCPVFHNMTEMCAHY